MESRGRGRVRAVRIFIMSAIAAGLVAGFASAALASLTTPANGATVRGDVTISENTGGRNDFGCSTSGVNGRIRVFRDSDGVTVFDFTSSGKGSFSTTWVSHGNSLGSYRILSESHDRFLGSLCGLSTATKSDIHVTLDNLSQVSYTGATSGPAGAGVTTSALLKDSVSGRVIAGRTVTFAFDGGPSAGSCVTGAGGTCSATVTAPAAGTHTLSTAFAQDCCWHASSSSTTFTSNQGSLALQGATHGYTGAAASVAARLTNVLTGAPISGRTVLFSVGSATGSAVTDGNGVASASITLLNDPGAVAETATFTGDSTFAGASASGTFRIDARPTTLTYTGDTSGLRHESAQLSATLTDTLTGSPLTGQSVTLSLAGFSTDATTDGNGVASASTTLSDAAGAYDATASYAGDTTHAASAASVPFNIELRPTTVVLASDSAGFWDEDTSLSATVTDTLDSSPLAGATVTFSIGSSSVSTTTGLDGVAQATIHLSGDAGSYTTLASFAGSEDNAAASASSPFEIDARPTTLVYSGDTSGFWDDEAAVSATLTDIRAGLGLAGQTITFTVGTQSATATTNAAGVAATTIHLTDEGGSYTVAAAFSDGAHYASGNDSAAFQIEKRPTTLVYSGDTNGLWDDDATLTATLTDSRTGSAVEGADVEISFGSVDVTATTGAGGVATVTKRLADDAGSYPLSAGYAGNQFRTGSSDSASFEVELRPTTLTYTGDASGFWNETATLTAKLTDDNRGAGVEGKTVALTFGSHSIELATDAAGDVSTTVSLDEKPASVAIGSAFGGDHNYAASSDSDSFDLRKRPTSLVYTGATQGKRGHGVTLSATLTDVRLASGLEGKAVHFTLGSFEADATTDAAGHASVETSLDQAPGQYTAAASFAGGDYYADATASHSFAIDWEYVFKDANGNGTVNLNLSTREWELVAGDDDSGIVHDPSMTIVNGPDSVTPPSPPPPPCDPSSCVTPPPPPCDPSSCVTPPPAPCDTNDPSSCVPSVSPTSCVDDPTGGDPVCPSDYTPTLPPAPCDTNDLPSCVPDVTPPPAPCDTNDPASCVPDVNPSGLCVDDPTGGSPICPGDYLPPLPGGHSAKTSANRDAAPPCDPTSDVTGCVPEPPAAPCSSATECAGYALCNLPQADGCAQRFVIIAYHGSDANGGDITLTGLFDLRSGAFTAAAVTSKSAHVLLNLGTLAPAVPTPSDTPSDQPTVPPPPCDPTADPTSCVPAGARG